MAKDIEVGPYAFIGANVTLGSGTKIGQACRIEGFTSIGRSCQIFTGAVIGSPPQDLKFKKGIKSFVKIGNNNIIREYVTINPGTGEGEVTKIGDNNLLMAYSHVAHNCTLADGVIISNVGTLAGHVTIEDKVVIGGLAGVHQFVRVGTLSMLGGCSKATQDILPFYLYEGQRAEPRGLNIIGLKRSGVSAQTREDLKKAFKILLNSGLIVPNALKKIKDAVSPSKEVTHLIEFVRSSQRGIAR